MKNRNKTGMVLSLIYCFVLYAILSDAPPGEMPDHPLWTYAMIPFGATVITTLFDYVIKYDVFTKKKK